MSSFRTFMKQSVQEALAETLADLDSAIQRTVNRSVKRHLAEQHVCDPPQAKPRRWEPAEDDFLDNAFISFLIHTSVQMSGRTVHALKWKLYKTLARELQGKIL